MNRYIHSRKAKRKTSKIIFKILLWFIAPFIILTPLLLWGTGFMLVSSDSFKHHTWGLVLEGQHHGMYRSEAAIHLLKKHKIDSLVFSGGLVIPGLYRSGLYVEHAIKEGIPEKRLFQVFQNGESTLEEALEVIPFFRQKKIDTVVVITSSYHSSRAKRILNQVSQNNPVFIFSQIEDPEYNPDNWMLHRHSQAIFVLEWIKTINSWMESFAEVKPYNEVSWHQGRSVTYRKINQISSDKILTELKDSIATKDFTQLNNQSVTVVDSLEPKRGSILDIGSNSNVPIIDSQMKHRDSLKTLKPHSKTPVDKKDSLKSMDTNKKSGGPKASKINKK